jgi:hypothetical protein
MGSIVRFTSALSAPGGTVSVRTPSALFSSPPLGPIVELFIGPRGSPFPVGSGFDGSGGWTTPGGAFSPPPDFDSPQAIPAQTIKQQRNGRFM